MQIYVKNLFNIHLFSFSAFSLRFIHIDLIFLTEKLEAQ